MVVSYVKDVWVKLSIIPKNYKKAYLFTKMEEFGYNFFHYAN